MDGYACTKILYFVEICMNSMIMFNFTLIISPVRIEGFVFELCGR